MPTIRGCHGCPAFDAWNNAINQPVEMIRARACLARHGPATNVLSSRRNRKALALRCTFLYGEACADRLGSDGAVISGEREATAEMGSQLLTFLPLDRCYGFIGGGEFLRDETFLFLFFFLKKCSKVIRKLLFNNCIARIDVYYCILCILLLGSQMLIFLPLDRYYGFIGG